jgi:acyl-CoA synthetase (AMP-forming)/AMP-acid ligase II
VLPQRGLVQAGSALAQAEHGAQALVFPGERKSYDAVVTSVLRRARGLKALGVKRGDHVGILLPSSIEFVETLFANAMLGAVSVLMNARYKAPEVAYVTHNADLTTIVTGVTPGG